MTEQDMIAEFIARNGATKVPEGKRAMDNRQMWASITGEAPRNTAPRLASVDHAGRELWVNADNEPISFG